ncbi:MAG: class I SAM-dependent methyltransferase [Desulfobacterales bacterium]|nr:MAG: class I SAM-dependent methyltransferase [Desulfobacterales bacterium]
MNKFLKIERIPGVLASSYEKATQLAIDSYYCQVAEEILAYFKEGTILDLGTGPGYLPIEILKRSPAIKIIGVDLSRKLIRMANSNAIKAGVSDRVSFEVGNAAKLRYNNNSFEMVISTGMLHSLKNPLNVLIEINRVLKNGGEAWIYDPARIIQFIDREKWKASLNIRERFFLWFFGLLGLHKPIAVYRRDQVIPMIEAAGFQSHSIEEGDGEIKLKLTK